MVKLLHIGIETGKGKWLDKALRKVTDYAEINCNLPDSEIKALFDKHNPDCVFMQIQTANVVDIGLVEYMSTKAIVINWSGDVRAPLPQWYKDFDKYCITCFSNMHDCKEINAEFLQIGIDTDIYTRRQSNDGSDIVFMANWSDGFTLSSFRWEAVEALKSHFKDRFQVYGGWPGSNGNFMNRQKDESLFYSGSKIGISISHFDYGRYFSDRLIRIMGSGCFALSHHYEDIEKDFKVGYHLDSFKTIDEMILKCEFYLKNSILRQTIALKGYNYVQDCFSVDVMVEEILRIYEKYSTIRQLVRSL